MLGTFFVESSANHMKVIAKIVIILMVDGY